MRYVSPEPSDIRMQLAECLRMSPPSAAYTPERLAGEFASMAEHLSSLETPDFASAALFEKVARSLSQGILETKGLSQIDCLRFIGEQILERKKHKRYLVQVQRHVDTIQGLQRHYDIDLRNRLECLREAVGVAETLAIEHPIEIAARRFNFSIAFSSLRRKQQARKNEDFFPSLTFKYSVLLQREIIIKAAPSLSPELLVDTYITFTLLPLESWQVTVTHRTPKLDRQLAQQEFTAEEILILRNTNPKATFFLAKTAAEPGGLFEVSCLHFVQALQEIRSGT